jgi:hypothetical protein
MPVDASNRNNYIKKITNGLKRNLKAEKNQHFMKCNVPYSQKHTIHAPKFLARYISPA